MPAQHPAEFLRALLDASPSGIIALNPDGRVQLWSRGAERILGWTEEDVLGRPLPLELQLHSAHEREVELRPRRKDGTVIDVELRTGPWTDSQGTNRGTLAIVADITRRLAVEREFRDRSLAIVLLPRRGGKGDGPEHGPAR